jgi:hypothetical protein
MYFKRIANGSIIYAKSQPLLIFVTLFTSG